MAKFSLWFRTQYLLHLYHLPIFKGRWAKRIGLPSWNECLEGALRTVWCGFCLSYQRILQGNNPVFQCLELWFCTRMSMKFFWYSAFWVFGLLEFCFLKIGHWFALFDFRPFRFLAFWHSVFCHSTIRIGLFGISLVIRPFGPNLTHLVCEKLIVLRISDSLTSDSFCRFIYFRSWIDDDTLLRSCASDSGSFKPTNYLLNFQATKSTMLNENAKRREYKDNASLKLVELLGALWNLALKSFRLKFNKFFDIKTL